MKRAGILAASASVAAAVASTAFSVSSSTLDLRPPRMTQEENRENLFAERNPSTDKFAPRFDGLRFIETLITAHR